jgi:hypothetical protein
MKFRPCLTGLLSFTTLFLGGMVYTLSAAQEPTAKESPQRSSLGGSVFGNGGIDIRDVQFEIMNSNSDGKVEFKGRVVLRSDQFDLDCEFLIFDPDKQEMKATGSPINFRQGQITAKCNNLVYNVEKKRSRLTGKPQILERQQTQIITAWHDIITIDQGGDGLSWNLSPAPNSSNTGGINVEQIAKKKKDDSPDNHIRKKPKPIKNDVRLIKVPERD